MVVSSSVEYFGDDHRELHRLEAHQLQFWQRPNLTHKLPTVFLPLGSIDFFSIYFHSLNRIFKIFRTNPIARVGIRLGMLHQQSEEFGEPPLTIFPTFCTLINVLLTDPFVVDPRARQVLHLGIGNKVTGYTR